RLCGRVSNEAGASKTNAFPSWSLGTRELKRIPKLELGNEGIPQSNKEGGDRAPPLQRIARQITTPRSGALVCPSRWTGELFTTFSGSKSISLTQSSVISVRGKISCSLPS